MVVPILLEILGGGFMLVAGYHYVRSARSFCERVRTQAQQSNSRWRTILYPAWFWQTQLCVVQLQASGIGMMLVGVILLIAAGLNIFARHW